MTRGHAARSATIDTSFPTLAPGNPLELEPGEHTCYAPGIGLVPESGVAGENRVKRVSVTVP